MKLLKRIAALIGAAILIGLYAATFIFAIMDSPHAENYFKASLFATVFIPVLLYGMILIYKQLKKDNSKANPDNHQEKTKK